VPSLDTFKTYDQERQDGLISTFAHLNPGIYMETLHNRKIAGTKIVKVGETRYGGPVYANQIIWGESLNIKTNF
jgi:hypothetical protein